MSETREVKDLAIGDVIQVDGFDDQMVVRSAKKLKKGLDAGKLEVALVAPDGEREVMAFTPEERVKVVGKDAEAGKGKGDGKAKGKGKGKAKAKAKSQQEAEAAVGSDAPTSKPKAEKSKKLGRQKAQGEKKMSALDAAAKILSETGQAMNCQEMIRVMAEKGYWTSPGGKTPASTLYSAILRETQTKGKDARFRKTERGKFEAANSK
jgi:hypothetical protein